MTMSINDLTAAAREYRELQAMIKELVARYLWLRRKAQQRFAISPLPSRYRRGGLCPAPFLFIYRQIALQRQKPTHQIGL